MSRVIDSDRRRFLGAAMGTRGIHSRPSSLERFERTFADSPPTSPWSVTVAHYLSLWAPFDGLASSSTRRTGHFRFEGCAFGYTQSA